jgi:hypothetical protein
VLPCYLSYRIIQHDRPVTSATLRALADDLLIPGLTRFSPRVKIYLADREPSGRWETRWRRDRVGAAAGDDLAGLAGC